MKRKLTYLVLIILVSTLGFWHNDAQAQGDINTWFFETTINTDAIPLEISGGAAFPDLDTAIVLDQTDLANLHVYNVNRNTRSVESTSTIPVNTPAFGLGHVIRSANDTAHSCFVDGAQHQLYATHSENAVDWDKLMVTNDTDFSSCDTAVENGNVFVGACNFGADEYRVYQSADNGQTWNLIETIGNVLCAFEGGTRANFNRVDGESVIFYMTGSNVMMAAEKDQLDTTRLVESGELIVAQGNDKKKVDQDSPGPPLAETYPGVVGEVTIIAYYHRDSNTIKLVVLNPSGIMPLQIITLGPAPMFNKFFGISCAEGPKGIANIFAPGRHFTYNTDTGEVGSINVNPLVDDTDGPVAAMSEPGIDEPVLGIFFIGSLDYAQYGRINRNIPTLSEWGLLAMAGILGLIGLFAIRRRKVSA